MNTTQPLRRVQVVVGMVLAAGIALALYVLTTLRSGASRPLPQYGMVADFTLTNQSGQRVTLTNLLGHIWVADVIFTRCAGPCPKMTRQMRELQEVLPSSSTAMLVTVTTDPEFDTPPVLAAYAERFKADTNRWIFLTGPRRDTAALVSGSLKLTAVEKAPQEREAEQDLYIHSTLFVLVDKHGHLRGIYETSGEGIEPGAVRNRILADMRRLDHEL
jgi:protein SCO1